MIIAAVSLFAQSAEYTKHLEAAKKYEAEKKWCHALGEYYDALCTDDETSVKQEACDGYFELKTAILTGNPGKGKYNAFTIHDEWKKLLMDAEQVGSSFPKYELYIGDLVQGDLNYQTKTASYSVSIGRSVCNRYEKTVDVVRKGYGVAYKEDWSSDLPNPGDWPLTSDSPNNDGVYNVKGALVFRKDVKQRNGSITTKFWNAFAVEETLFDYKFNIVDESGRELIKAKRFLLGKEKELLFEGVPPDVMDLIDNGKAFVNPVAVYLEYGKYIPEDDKGGRSFIKNFPEITLNLADAVFYGENQKGDTKRTNYEEILNENAIRDFILVDIPGTDYSVSMTEVTNLLYNFVMGLKSGGNYPVTNVSWYDAIYFCNKMSELSGKTPVYSVNSNTDINTWDYTPHEGNKIFGDLEQDISANGFRLLTNKEWTYAAKGGQKFRYSGSDNLDEVGWYLSNSWDDKLGMRLKHPVAMKKANGYGLFDMSGNVAEWIWPMGKVLNADYGYYDNYDANYAGGSFRDSCDKCEVWEWEQRGRNGNDGSEFIGFRIACSSSK